MVRYLPTPHSNAEIAGQLYITLNTLKTHLRRIRVKYAEAGRPAEALTIRPVWQPAGDPPRSRRRPPGSGTP